MICPGRPLVSKCECAASFWQEWLLLLPPLPFSLFLIRVILVEIGSLGKARTWETNGLFYAAFAEIKMESLSAHGNTHPTLAYVNLHAREKSKCSSKADRHNPFNLWICAASEFRWPRSACL